MTPTAPRSRGHFAAREELSTKAQAPRPIPRDREYTSHRSSTPPTCQRLTPSRCKQSVAGPFPTGLPTGLKAAAKLGHVCAHLYERPRAQDRWLPYTSHRW